jgi:hypothetical protein
VAATGNIRFIVPFFTTKKKNQKKNVHCSIKKNKINKSTFFYKTAQNKCFLAILNLKLIISHIFIIILTVFLLLKTPRIARSQQPKKGLPINIQSASDN